MSNVAHAFPQDEVPTRPAAPVTSNTLALLTRIDRLAELAQERLLLDPDADAIAGAVSELASIRHLAAEVLR